MKREVIAVVFLLILSNVLYVSAADPKVDKAYACLESKVIGKCSSLSPEERVFSLLAIGECKQELIDSAKKIDGKPQCWPSSSCDVALTSKALLALEASQTLWPNLGNSETSKVVDWLLSQKMVPSGISWYLQIESDEETTCEIIYQGGSAQLTLGLDKKIKTLNGGNCFTKAQQDYWLQIAPSCKEKEFEISCNKDFLTNLIYQEPSSSTYFVSEKTHRAGVNGATGELIESYCFKQGSACSYEGSLWAAFSLDYVGYSAEVDPFVPYLVSLSGPNPRYIPEVFLYHLTGDSEYKTSLFEKQRVGKYWQLSTSNNKFYDTALALYPFQSESFPEKNASMTYMLSQQDSQGCWEGNIRNTAFLLHSLWQQDRPIPECSVETERLDCDLNEICTNKKCVGGCRNDTSCSEEFICATNKTCVKGPDCTISNEATKCGDGRICSSSQTCIAGCRNDGACDDGQICNANLTCVSGCRADPDCGDGEICTNLLCVDGCRNDPDCGDGKICSNLTCVDGCNNNADCTSPGISVCSPLNICVECTPSNSSSCTSQEKCLDNNCVPKDFECIGNSQCTNSSKPVCNQDTNSCVRCNVNSECGNTSLECTSNHTCVVKPQCRYNTECNVTIEFCNTAINKCELIPECEEDVDCIDKGYDECKLGKCINNPDPPECTTLDPCDPGFVCIQGACEEGCDSDEGCPESYPFCSANDLCVECVISDDCGEGYYCSDINTCLEATDTCTDDDECDEDNEVCDDDGYCVPYTESKPRCVEDWGYFCRSGIDCKQDGGTDLSDDYDCNTPDNCCSVGANLPTCDFLSGNICQSSQLCDGGQKKYDYSDWVTGEFCCVSGECKDAVGESSVCEDNGGACRDSCNSDEDVSYDACTLSSDYCCVSQNTGGGGGGGEPGKSYLWLWIFLALVVLAILGLIFRNNIRVALMKLRSGMSKDKPHLRPGFPGMPPPTSSLQMSRPIPRAILPPQQSQRPMPPRPMPPTARPPSRPEIKKTDKEKPKSDLDDVLKKLKEMGK